jgi:hypothetical protein
MLVESAGIRQPQANTRCTRCTPNPCGYTVIGVPPLRLQTRLPGVTSVFEMRYFNQLPATYSRYLSLEFLHVSQLRQLLSSRNQRISVRKVGCTSAVRAHAASFQLSNSTHSNVATRSRLPHLVNTRILAQVGALADLAIPCFCLKPLSHTMAAPFLPSLSTVRRSALYPQAILREQISVRRGGQFGFLSGFVPC